MKGKQLKLVSAGFGACAVVAMGAFGVALSESPSADTPVQNVSTGIEPTLGETSTETTAPTEPETTVFTPPVEVELPDGYGPPE